MMPRDTALCTNACAWRWTLHQRLWLAVSWLQLAFESGLGAALEFHGDTLAVGEECALLVPAVTFNCTTT